MILRIITAWIILILLDLLIIRDINWLIENYAIKRVVVNFSLTSIALLLLLPILSRIISISKSLKTLVFFTIAVPLLVQSTHFEIYKSFTSMFGFYIFFENPLMVLTTGATNVNIFKNIVILISVYFIINILDKPVINKGLLQKILFIINIIVFTFLYLLTTFSWYGKSDFQNSILGYYSTLLQISRSKTLKIKRNKPAVIKSTKPVKDLPNIIFIIGESLAKSNMGIYGYHKNTTPNLKKLIKNKSLIKINNATSIGTHTILSVPYMLVGIEGIDPKGRFYQTPTIFNYAKARGYATAFISSQDTKWGQISDLFLDKSVDYFWDGVQMNKNASVHKGANDIAVLQKIVFPYINNQYKKSTKPFFIVLQMDGSHYPYSEHSTQKHKKFLPEASENSINAYDNTVVKTDDYISQIVIKMRQDYPNSWVFYSSDHGQDFGGANGYFNSKFSNGVINNAMLISPPKKYYQQIMANQNKPISQADIVPTILQIMEMDYSKNINGQSLLQKINKDRLRIVSRYMPTQHNEPIAVLVKPNLERYFIDFEKMNVVLPNQKTIKFKNWQQKYQQMFKLNNYSE